MILRWAGLVGLWMASAAVAGAVEHQKFVIHLLDYARISGGTLEKTAAGAQHILAEAGVDTEWRTCLVPGRRGDCNLSPDDRSPIVRIVRKGGKSMVHVFGAAIKTFDHGLTGIYATIFYDLAADASRRSAIEPSVLLSCAVAHEVGELLGLDHASEGIMHAAYDGADLERAAKGRLQFSAAEALRLRAVVQARRSAPAIDFSSR